MSFLLPWGLLAALSVPLIIILYMLKRKSRREPVSSTMLWERLEQIISPAINLSRLRKNLLLFLQLAAALLLALALAQPAINRAGAAEDSATTIIVVDTSISMAVQDSGENSTRLEQARQQIRDRINSRGPREQVAIIGMADQAYLISGISADSQTLLRSVDSLSVTGATANIGDALVMAENIARSQGKPSLLLISDGMFDDSALNVSFPVTYLPLGKERVENLLIEDLVSDQNRLYLTVRNNGTVPARGRVLVKNNLGQTAGQRELELAPGESKMLVWRELEPSPWFQGELTSATDQLLMDNVRYAVNKQQENSRLLLVTAGNLFLERVLMLQPSLSVTRIKPEHYLPSSVQEYDLFVFDGFLPEDLPPAPVLAFDPPHPSRHLNSTPPAAAGNLLPSTHRLLTHVDLSEVRISFGKFLSGGEPLLVTDKGTLGAEYTRQGQPLVVFGFAVQAGDLPLRPAFPILIRNIMDYFTGFDPEPGRFAFGQPLIIEPPYQTDRLTLTFPGGTVITAAAPFPYHGPVLLETGIYTVSAAEGTAGEVTRTAAVNPPVSVENLGFRESIAVNGEPVAGRPERSAKTSVYTPLLLIAFLLTGLEWWVDNRGY